METPHPPADRPADVVVVGSLNVDLTATVHALPRPGETVTGSALRVLPGGKGANQAVAAARLGARTELLGAVGQDAHGDVVLRAAAAAGVGTEHVRRLPGTPTGSALIVVDRDAENTIVVSPGANGELAPGDVDRAAALLGAARVLCLCLEIPVPTVLAAARTARAAGARVVLNLSPYAEVPRELFALTDVLLVNGTEAAALLGLDAPPLDRDGWTSELLRTGAAAVVVTLGAAGALVCTPAGTEHVPTPRVTAVDTTGCGDAFTGALAARLADGDALVAAARVACSVAALAATRSGAQSSYPTAAELGRVAPGTPAP